MTSHKTIAVIGATGGQGGSVVETFLALPGWHVRAITRNSSSRAALNLKAKGADVVVADLDDEESLRRAFEEAHGIFAVTDFWGPIADRGSYKAAKEQGIIINQWAYNLEYQRGQNIARAAAASPQLERFVFSSLAPVSEITQGRYKWVYHFDSKAAVVDYINKDLPGLAQKMSIIQVGYFYTNLFTPGWGPKKQEDGTFTITHTCPKDSKHPFISIEHETGPFVKALLIDEAPGTNLLAYSEWLSFGEVAEMLSRVTGEPCSFIEGTIEQAEAAVPWFGREIAESKRFSAEYGFDGGQAIHPKDLRTRVPAKGFEEWMREQDWTTVLKPKI